MPKVEEVVAKVLNVDPAIIKDTTTPADIESWDSFNGLVLVTELENAYRVKFTLDEVISVKKVGDIKDILKKHGVPLEGEQS